MPRRAPPRRAYIGHFAQNSPGFTPQTPPQHGVQSVFENSHVLANLMPTPVFSAVTAVLHTSMSRGEREDYTVILLVLATSAVI